MPSWWDSVDVLRSAVGYLRWGTVAATVLSLFAAASVALVSNRLDTLTTLKNLPRRLTTEQFAAIASVASQAPRTRLEVMATTGDFESEAFAKQLTAVFSSAKWAVNMGSGTSFPSLPPGLFVRCNPERPDVQLVMAALTAANLTFGRLACLGVDGTVTIAVSSKP